MCYFPLFRYYLLYRLFALYHITLPTYTEVREGHRVYFSKLSTRKHETARVWRRKPSKTGNTFKSMIIEFSISCFRIFVIVFSCLCHRTFLFFVIVLFCHRTFLFLSSYFLVLFVLSCFCHRTFVFLSSYFRVFVIVLSYFRVLR